MNTYELPRPLVNALIVAILSSLLGIAGYMVVWNGADHEFKAEVLTKLAYIERDIEELKDASSSGR